MDTCTPTQHGKDGLAVNNMGQIDTVGGFV